jgi:hypothetical protein
MEILGIVITPPVVIGAVYLIRAVVSWLASNKKI